MRNTLSLVLGAALLCSPLLLGKDVPPEGAAPKPLHLSTTEDFSLPNGMKVTLVPYGAVPKVAIRAVVDAGRMREGQQQTWLSDLAGRLLEEGTESRSSTDVANAVADMGGQLEISTTRDATVAGSYVLTESGEKFVGLLAEVLMHPKLPDSEVARLKADLSRRLAVEKSEPASIARAAFLGKLYPDQPWSKIFPSEAEIAGYKIADVRAFYDANYAASRTHLYVAGKYGPGLRPAIEKAFSGWRAGKASPVPPTSAATQYSLQVIDRPGAPQATINMGMGVPPPKSPDAIPFEVMNTLLGGAFVSRITANLREKHGYTYSPVSLVSEAGHGSYWVQIADVTTAVTGPSIREVFSEIHRLRNEPPPADEVSGIKNYLSGIFVLRNTVSADALIRQLQGIDFQGLDRSYLNTYLSRVNAVTAAQIQQEAQKYLVPSKMTITVVGDKSKINAQLESFKTAPGE